MFAVITSLVFYVHIPLHQYARSVIVLWLYYLHKSRNDHLGLKRRDFCYIRPIPTPGPSRSGNARLANLPR